MNNKGFAITTVLYGTLILFLMLLLSMLGILSAYKDRMSMLIDNNNGARDIINGYTKSNDVEEFPIYINGLLVTSSVTYNEDGAIVIYEAYGAEVTNVSGADCGWEYEDLYLENGEVYSGKLTIYISNVTDDVYIDVDLP